MVTDRAIVELVRWGQAASEGEFEAADGHIRRFYHFGATLVASKEFQAAWQAGGHKPLSPAQLDNVCELLGVIARVEANQVSTYGRA